MKIREQWSNVALAASPDGDPDEVMLGAAVTSTFLKGLLFDHLSGGCLADPAATLERFISIVEGEDA